ncbi:MAG TPA: alpha-L-fucosidase [Bacteroidales bacterium]|nr:alpha-L-fucosidase [Bacteroidales bacterium]
MKNKFLIALIINFICNPLCNAQDKRHRISILPDPEVLQKVKERQDLKFGLFMHWGPYSQWRVLESWTLCTEDYGWITRHGLTRGAEYNYAVELLIAL